MTGYAGVVKLQRGADSACNTSAPDTTTPGKEIVMFLQYIPLPPPQAFLDRFWSKVDRNGPVSECRPDLGSCWLWTACLNGRGYGFFGVTVEPGRTMNRMAHVVAFVLEHGPVPDGLVLDHLCRVRHCIRPSHLEPVSNRTNVLRGIGPTAVNAAKDVCKYGHNDWRSCKQGIGRSCRECNRFYDRLWKARKRLEREGE